MMLTEDEGLRIAMKQRIEDERCFGKIELDPTATFLDWKDDGFTRNGTSTITARTRRGYKGLNVGLKLEGSLLVIKANGSEKKTDAVIGIGRYLTQKVVKSQKFEKLLRKEKHGATFVTLENDIGSSKILTDANITRSDAFFRFMVAERANVLPIPANIEQWYQRPKTMCRRYDKHTKPMLAHILNDCPANCTEMTRHHNKVVDVMRRAIEEQMANRLHTRISENTTMRGEGLSEEMRRLKPDLNFVASTYGMRFTLIIDISCPYGCISYGENTLRKVYVDKLEKYARLAQEIKADQYMLMEIIPVIVSSLGVVHEQSFKAFGQLFMCEEREEKKLVRRLSEAAIAGSLEIW
jgi:hypothetical protein